jgi:hypothetical protein
MKEKGSGLTLLVRLNLKIPKLKFGVSPEFHTVSDELGICTNLSGTSEIRIIAIANSGLLVS